MATRLQHRKESVMPTASPRKHSLRMQIQEVEREIRMRRQVYPRLISKGQMRNGEAVELIETMESVLETLQQLQEQEQRKAF